MAKRKRRQLPNGFTEEHLRHIAKELRLVQAWSDGYQAARGSVMPTIPGTGLMGGPARAVALINQLLQESA